MRASSPAEALIALSSAFHRSTAGCAQTTMQRPHHDDSSPAAPEVPAHGRSTLFTVVLLVAVMAASAAAGLALTRLLQRSTDGIDPTATPVATLPAADVAGEDVADLPRFPGAIRMLFALETQGATAVTSLAYTASAGVDEVRSFYRRAFREHGWEVRELDFSVGEWTFLVTSGQRVALIEIEPREPFTDIEIEIEEPASDGGPPSEPAPTTAPPQPPPPPGDDEDD
jgi:hypothetical protein